MAALRPCAFFDRDGTLTSDHGYTYRPEDLAFMEGAPRAIRMLNEAGWLVVVVTNQSGVARGYFDENGVVRFHAAMNAALAEHGATIDAFYYCPFHADAKVEAYRHPDHPDRKPNPGMIRRAIADLPIDPARSFLVGDAESDLAAAKAAGIRARLYTGGDLAALVTELMAAP
jgi:D-glycero-D-manno-heptose 1,7-bisphosphate phosphatase